MKVDI